MKLINIIILLLIVFFSSDTSRKILINYNQDAGQIVDSLNISKKDLYITIDKSEMILSIHAKDTIIKQYPVALGGNPIGDKLMEGDKCTPEGTFKIRSKFPHKKWTKFIWINYPTDESYKKHNAAKKKGLIPADAKIGGEIGIHGVPAGMDILVDNYINYTEGCVSLKTEDINELYDIAFTKMKVIIKK